jgi:uncharacterized YccA/Bax inhibitor family protein
MTAGGGVQERQTGNPAFKEEVYVPAGRDESVMTVSGTVMKAFFFTAILIVGAVMGWSFVEPDASGAIVWPWWSWWLSLGAFVMALITIMNPHLAAVTGSIYSLLQGMVMGALSAVYDAAWNGIVLQAVIVTIAIMVAVLVLYLLGVLRATPRFTKMVIIGTAGVALLYLFAFIMALFGVDAVFWSKPTSAGLFWALVVVALAALNFVLDFDAIERYVAAGAPKQLEWHAAFGVILTLVWLYLEVLRMIVRSRARQ